MRDLPNWYTEQGLDMVCTNCGHVADHHTDPALGDQRVPGADEKTEFERRVPGGPKWGHEFEEPANCHEFAATKDHPCKCPGFSSVKKLLN
jgi:hypothetical protein